MSEALKNPIENYSQREPLPEREIIQESNYPILWTEELIDQVVKESKAFESEKLTTSLIELDLEKVGLGKVWIKDESTNPTGTHKDRLARAVAQHFLYEAKNQSRILHKEPKYWKEHSDNYSHLIPRYSLITSGHGGMAVAKLFQEHNLPPPKLLMDKHTSPEVINALKEKNADIYLTDLGKKELSRSNILELTNNNQDNYDLTSETSMPDGLWRIYYHDLGVELFEQHPQNIFIPYGSGNLFESIMVSQYLTEELGGKEINIYGAEPDTLETKAVMLAAPSKPFKYFDPKTIKSFRKNHSTGKLTDVYKVSESSIEQAHELYKGYGVKAGFSSSAALGLYLEKCKQNPKLISQKNIIINTGRGIEKKDW